MEACVGPSQARFGTGLRGHKTALSSQTTTGTRLNRRNGARIARRSSMARIQGSEHTPDTTRSGGAKTVTVSAPARLHLGFLDLNGSLGRKFGSIGLAVDDPSTALTVSEAATFSSAGPEKDRTLKLVQRLAAALDLKGCYRVDVSEAIPAHAGLGSGTQLALSIGTGLAQLSGRRVSTRDLGELVERGARSAIGMAAFENGGFVIDGGRGPGDHAPPVLARHDFPDAWRIILVFDPKAVGVHGDREKSAFATLPTFPESQAGHLSRLILMQLLPGLVEADLSTFGASLTQIQKIVGGHFAPAQGGSPWSSPAVGRICTQLEAAGAQGIGQSSWGPTGFAFAQSDAVARKLYSTLVDAARREGLELKVVRGRNSGARVNI
jgi:beta-ribofuranosylaminobenzene 5'-phosphate synthase